MSMQQGANTVEETMQILRPLLSEMLEFRECINAVREISIHIGGKGDFAITSD
jgi:hypothetical protein